MTVSCALPFTTNVTISTSISQTFRSWVAIFRLHQPMVFLSHSSYGMPGLAPLMNVLFLGRRDFHLSSSDRDMSRNRPSGSFMADMGISSNNRKSPSPKCYMTFWDMNRYYDTFNWSDITPICELITLLPILTLLLNFGGVHGTLQRVRLANRGRLLLRTPGPVPFGTCICSNVETIFSWTCHVHGPFEFRTSLDTSILLRFRVLHFLCKTLFKASNGEGSVFHDFTNSHEEHVRMGWKSIVMKYQSVMSLKN